MFETCLTSNIKTYLREYGSNLSGNARRTTISNWCKPPYFHSILRGRDPLLVLRILLACSLVVERSAVNRMVRGSNPPMPVFILRPWPNWLKALTFRVSDCGFESHWAYRHQCVGIEGYEDNCVCLSSSGCLGSESPKGNRSDTVIGMYSWKTFPWILFVLGQIKTPRYLSNGSNCTLE